MQERLSTIGNEILAISQEVISTPTIPIGTKMAFIEVGSPVIYTTGDMAIPLSLISGGALLEAGTKLDLVMTDLFVLRLMGTSAESGFIHITYLG